MNSDLVEVNDTLAEKKRKRKTVLRSWWVFSGAGVDLLIFL